MSRKYENSPKQIEDVPRLERNCSKKIIETNKTETHEKFMHLSINYTVNILLAENWNWLEENYKSLTKDYVSLSFEKW